MLRRNTALNGVAYSSLLNSDEEKIVQLINLGISTIWHKTDWPWLLNDDQYTFTNNVYDFTNDLNIEDILLVSEDPPSGAVGDPKSTKLRQELKFELFGRTVIVYPGNDRDWETIEYLRY